MNTPTSESPTLCLMMLPLGLASALLQTVCSDTACLKADTDIELWIVLPPVPVHFYQLPSVTRAIEQRADFAKTCRAKLQEQFSLSSNQIHIVEASIKESLALWQARHPFGRVTLFNNIAVTFKKVPRFLLAILKRYYAWKDILLENRMIRSKFSRIIKYF